MLLHGHDPAEQPARSVGSVKNPWTSSGESLVCEQPRYAYPRCARQHSTERCRHSPLIGWLVAARKQKHPRTYEVDDALCKLMRSCQIRTVGAAHALGSGIESQPWRAIPSTQCTVPDDCEVARYLKDGSLQSRREHCRRVHAAVNIRLHMQRVGDRHSSSLTDFSHRRCMAGVAGRT